MAVVCGVCEATFADAQALHLHKLDAVGDQKHHYCGVCTQDFPDHRSHVLHAEDDPVKHGHCPNCLLRWNPLEEGRKPYEAHLPECHQARGEVKCCGCHFRGKADGMVGHVEKGKCRKIPPDAWHRRRGARFLEENEAKEQKRLELQLVNAQQYPQRAEANDLPTEMLNTLAVGVDDEDDDDDRVSITDSVQENWNNGASREDESPEVAAIRESLSQLRVTKPADDTEDPNNVNSMYNAERDLWVCGRATCQAAFRNKEQLVHHLNLEQHLDREMSCPAGCSYKKMDTAAKMVQHMMSGSTKCALSKAKNKKLLAKHLAKVSGGLVGMQGDRVVSPVDDFYSRLVGSNMGR